MGGALEIEYLCVQHGNNRKTIYNELLAVYWYTRKLEITVMLKN